MFSKLAKDKHALWLEETSAKGLFFKKRQGTREDIWQVYVGDDHRALCL